MDESFSKKIPRIPDIDIISGNTSNHLSHFLKLILNENERVFFLFLPHDQKTKQVNQIILTIPCWNIYYTGMSKLFNKIIDNVTTRPNLLTEKSNLTKKCPVRDFKLHLLERPEL